MTTYSTVRNPLLDDGDNIKSQSHHRFRESTSSFRSFLSQIQLSNVGNRLGSKRIVPSFSNKDKRKHHHKNQDKKASTVASPSNSQPHRHRVKQRNEQNEPLVHYNGPLETLDQLPEEKLSWITKETSDDKELRHPLLDYPRSIVFRKPHNRNTYEVQ
jgi:hypothetical protein